MALDEVRRQHDVAPTGSGGSGGGGSCDIGLVSRAGSQLPAPRHAGPAGRAFDLIDGDCVLSPRERLDRFIAATAGRIHPDASSGVWQYGSPFGPHETPGGSGDGQSG